MSLSVLSQALSQPDIPEITEEIVVYRLSLQKIIEYLRLKVARLASPEVLEVSRTLIRGLAKDGLVEDGKENLLQGKFLSVVLTRLASQHSSQWGGFELPVTCWHNISLQLHELLYWPHTSMYGFFM
jgi:hypothetical protein